MAALGRQQIFLRGEPPKRQAVTLTLSFEQEDGQWVGTCLELGASTFADTIPAAYEELVDAILLHLNEAEDEGYIEQYLQARNVRVTAIEEHGPKGNAWSSLVESAV